MQAMFLLFIERKFWNSTKQTATIFFRQFLKYNRSSLGGHSRERRALLTADMKKTRLNSHTNSVFTHSRKRPRTLSRGTFWIFLLFQATISGHHKGTIQYSLNLILTNDLHTALHICLFCYFIRWYFFRINTV